jgi:hypothetical protein
MTPQFVRMAWCLIKGRYSLTLTLPRNVGEWLIMSDYYVKHVCVDDTCTCEKFQAVQYFQFLFTKFLFGDKVLTVTFSCHHGGMCEHFSCEMEPQN